MVIQFVLLVVLTWRMANVLTVDERELSAVPPRTFWLQVVLLFYSKQVSDLLNRQPQLAGGPVLRASSGARRLVIQGRESFNTRSSALILELRRENEQLLAAGQGKLPK